MNNLFIQELQLFMNNELSNTFDTDQMHKYYTKQGYQIDSYFLKLLSFVSNKQVNYNIDSEKHEINFKIQNILRNYPKRVIESYERKYSLKQLIPFAEIFNGYMVVVKDETNEIYGIYDDTVLLFGHSLIEGGQNILTNSEIKIISK